jgi:outer membrane lipoprotein-sorting protein
MVMRMPASFPRWSRWALPAGAVTAVGAVIAGTALAGAQGSPALPARTPAQLLASVSGSDQALPPMTATIQVSANLGLPSLPSAGDGQLTLPALLSGTHTIQLWYADPAHFRVAIPVQMGEADLRRDGRQLWLWNSTRNAATEVTLPPGLGQEGGPATPATPAVTPQQAARALLAAVGTTTRVGLQRNLTVAGQPAYQLTLVPKDHRSLIGQVRIAIDARRPLPLQVQIFARGSSAPALSIAYSSIGFGRPSASNFAFRPPHGAKVKRMTLSALAPPGALPAGWTGYPPLPVAVPGSPAYQSQLSIRAAKHATELRLSGQALARMRRQALEHLPKSMPKALRQAMIRAIAALPPGRRVVLKSVPVTCSYASTSSPTASTCVTLQAVATRPREMPQVIGHGWTSVLVLSAGTGPRRPSAGAGPLGGDLGAALSAATPVRGSWGSGRLLRTSLVSVLLENNGTVLVGAVQPSVLYAAAAEAG